MLTLITGRLTFPYIFMVLCLIKHGDNFNCTLLVFICFVFLLSYISFGIIFSKVSNTVLTSDYDMYGCAAI
jgi:hypothetical protein